MNPFEIQKKRELIFDDTEPEQIIQAYTLLSGLENIRVAHGNRPDSLVIHYSLEHYSLEGLEKAFVKEGFRFKEKNWREKLRDALINYCEDVQYHNLRTPEHPTKKISRKSSHKPTRISCMATKMTRPKSCVNTNKPFTDCCCKAAVSNRLIAEAS